MPCKKDKRPCLKIATFHFYLQKDLPFMFPSGYSIRGQKSPKAYLLLQKNKIEDKQDVLILNKLDDSFCNKQAATLR